MSGLTVGYLRVLSLELKITTGTDQEKEYAAKVLPILSNRHWLLCTLLLMNSFANEAMPVFLDRIFNHFTAVVISVTLLLVFVKLFLKLYAQVLIKFNIHQWRHL